MSATPPPASSLLPGGAARSAEGAPMSYQESVLRFTCEGEPLVGILAEPAAAPLSEVGVLIIVGGPQYRAGSHRQFTLLARHLARHGIAALRFDYRSMGDSGGDVRDFLGVDADIAAGIDALMTARPAVKRVVLWGLCDAASAALLYLESTGDKRVAGLTLLNPWARSAASLAQAHVKHYYWRRLREKSFWMKLLRGGVGAKALRALASNLRLARGGARPAADPRSFQERMAAGLRGFTGPTLLILSGDDYTAREFSLHAASSPAWQGLLSAGRVQTCELPQADHTFSDPAQTAAVEGATLNWLYEV